MTNLRRAAKSKPEKMAQGISRIAPCAAVLSAFLTLAGRAHDQPQLAAGKKAFVESMKIARERPDIVVASLVKHLRLREENAPEAYRSFADVWEEAPYVRADSVQAIIDFQPKETVKDITPEKYIDNNLIKELEASGFIKSLSRK